MKNDSMRIRVTVFSLLLLGCSFFLAGLWANAVHADVSPHNPEGVKVQVSGSESQSVHQIPADETVSVGIGFESGVLDAAAEAPGSPVESIERGDLGEGGDPRILWASDRLVRTGRVPSSGDLALDHAENNGDLYAAVLVPGSGINDTVEILVSTDDGATWSEWSRLWGSATNGGIDDIELIVGPGANPWIYNFALYNAAGANGGLWVRRMRADQSTSNWYQIVAGGDTMSDISADRSTGGGYNLFTSYILHGTMDRIRARRSTDDGMTWSSSSNISSGDRSSVRIAAGGDNYVYITYPVGDSMIRIGRNDNNLTGSWSFNDIETGGESDIRPWVAAARTTPGTSQSAWVFYRHEHSGGNDDLHYGYSTDGGGSWTSGPWPPTNVGPRDWNMNRPSLRVGYNYSVDLVGATAVLYTDAGGTPDSVISVYAMANDPTTWTSRVILNDFDATGEFGPRIDVTNGMGGRGVLYRRWADDEVYFDYVSNNVGVEEIIPDSAPRNFILAINRPNPFQSATNISFALPGSGETDLSIYDITGQKVITLYNGRLEAGSYSYSWSGIDDSGRELSSGIYFYRLSAGDFTSTKKLVLIR
jgi:hypothetical protein